MFQLVAKSKSRDWKGTSAIETQREYKRDMLSETASEQMPYGSINTMILFSKQLFEQRNRLPKNSKRNKRKRDAKGQKKECSILKRNLKPISNENKIDVLYEVMFPFCHIMSLRTEFCISVEL